MAKSKYQDDFEALGVEDVARRVSESIWPEEKAREARIWLNNQESRIARKQLTTQIVAAICAFLVVEILCIVVFGWAVAVVVTLSIVVVSWAVMVAALRIKRERQARR